MNDIRVNYYYERNAQQFVNISCNGRNYDRPCKLDGLNRPSFRFRRKLYKPDCRLQWYPQVLATQGIELV